jgi:membrane protein YdbS with pleckstrin-like domain
VIDPVTRDAAHQKAVKTLKGAARASDFLPAFLYGVLGAIFLIAAIGGAGLSVYVIVKFQAWAEAASALFVCLIIGLVGFCLLWWARRVWRKLKQTDGLER